MHWKNRSILIFRYSTQLEKKVRYSLSVLYSILKGIFAEYKDDQLIPRSSTVIVKRVPIIKGSKSRFGRYLAGGAPRQQQTYVMNQQKPIVTPAWARGTGAFSKRFDGRDEPKKAPVSILFYMLMTNIPMFLSRFSFWTWTKQLEIHSLSNIDNISKRLLPLLSFLLLICKAMKELQSKQCSKKKRTNGWKHRSTWHSE